MSIALSLAKDAAFEDEVPIGAVIVSQGGLISEAKNGSIHHCDPCGHAEIYALRQAGKVMGNHRLNGCDLYVTLEPCPMCLAAIMHARIQRLIFATEDPKGGFRQFYPPSCWPLFRHTLDLTEGVCREEARDLLTGFFQEKRARGKRKWLRPSSP